MAPESDAPPRADAPRADAPRADAPDAAAPDAAAPDAEAPARPAFYAARSGGWRDWWTLLHPPYTAWHLAYVVIGACLAPVVQLSRLVVTLLAFFFAVGIAAHALDELQGRPLRTRISSPALIAAAGLGVSIAVGLGIAGLHRVGWPLVPFIVIGPVLVVAYNAEWFGGRLHTDAGFAVAWGAFPVLTAYVAQTGRLSWPAVLGAVAALGLSAAQRALSTPARFVRRRVSHVEGIIVANDGSQRPVTAQSLIAPIEKALRLMSWSVVFFAAALAVARLH